MWKATCDCEDAELVAPPCCLDDTTEVSIPIDPTDRNAPLLGPYATKAMRWAWEGHDCGPVCSECGDDARWG